MKPIPISAAAKIAKEYGYNQIVIIGRAVGEHGGEHVTTYGTDAPSCEVAAWLNRTTVTQSPELPHSQAIRDRMFAWQAPINQGV